MDINAFWDIIETARRTGPGNGSFADALVDQLASRSKQDILEYQERFDEVHDALYRWDVWAAAYLIGGGCSDDSFIDFRAGLISLGRDWYENAAACADSLAGHPTVIAAAARDRDDALFCEEANYAAPEAFQRVTGADEDFYEAWRHYRESLGALAERPAEMGEDFDFDDPQEMHRRLPRLASLCLHDSVE
ncbi:DUF4240 domain-containing protein [Streptacidiphilus sp. N1-3]|uniref:DUF4240 domain-containing protein n=1 Tax=Streptacidiphilus alkalitolerans TaxID=3342712 RepID=A0ABV6X065_9ACTN